jgi:glycosyltransferase involved in cell wall biosynthesis
MKIIIATPISPPQVGGPAEYSQKLKEGLEKNGIEVKTISYFRFKKYPKPLRHFLYFLNLLKASKGADIIYAFNLVSCGLPAFLVARILRKKFTIRLGGDFLWERAIQEGRTKKLLREYYKDPKSLKEKVLIWVLKKILNEADKIIFTSSFQKEIYKEYFEIGEEKAIVIPNPFPEIKTPNHQPPITNYQLLYAGRLIKLKNLDKLIEVFARVLGRTNKSLTLKIIGEGPEKENLKFKIKNLKLENKIFLKPPISHFQLLKEIQASYLSVLPSLTEVSPNFALECIKLRKPILLTKETGIYEDFKDYLIFVDPQNPKDLEQKLIYLLDEKNYKNYLAKIKTIPASWSWNDIIEEHISLFKTLL